MIHGPNVRKLIVRKMTLIMVPSGGGMTDALAWMTRPGGFVQATREATIWVESALEAVKLTPNNRYGNDDDAIAGEILKRAGLS